MTICSSSPGPAPLTAMMLILVVNANNDDEYCYAGHKNKDPSNVLMNIVTYILSCSYSPTDHIHPGSQVHSEVWFGPVHFPIVFDQFTSVEQ